MNCIFLDQTGKTLFTRNDMESGHWVQQEMNLSASFPFDPAKRIEIGQRIAFRDPATDNLEVFEINICTNMNPDNYQQITAENIAIPELSDEHINSQKFTAQTAAQALTTVLTGTLWAVGTDITSGTQDADISRGSVWDAIGTIQQNWNVYITPRIVLSGGMITGRYLDIAPAEGIWRGVRLSIRKNFLDPAVTYDETELYTALYGYGGPVDKPRTGQDDETKELTFADEVWTATSDHPAKPSGQTYLEWPEKTALYGRNGRPRFGYYQNGSIKDAGILLQKTWESLKQCCDPKIQIAGGVVDLYRLGYKDQPIRLHDQAIVEIEETGEVFYKQIICCDVDLIDPSGTRVDIGDYIPNIIYINRDTDKKAGGGGGGGKGPGSLTNLEENQVYFDSEFVKSQQAIGMVVGMKNGQQYIKAASIIASINNDGGTNIKLTADTIDIDGLLTAFESEAITCGNINCQGSLDVDQDINCEGTVGGYIGSFDSLTVNEGLLDCYNIDCADISANDVTVEGSLTVGSDAAEWLSATVYSFTFSQAHNFVYRSGGQDYTTNGYIIGTKSSSTIHYLGHT